jgi:hypothetical protein
MAGTAHRWALPSALLAVSLLIYNENASTSFLSGAGRSPLWQCPECRWVEQWSKGRAPRCRGSEGAWHALKNTIRLDETHGANVGSGRFFR